MAPITAPLHHYTSLSTHNHTTPLPHSLPFYLTTSDKRSTIETARATSPLLPPEPPNSLSNSLKQLMLSHRFLAVTTSVSDNTEFQNAINNCASDTTCEIEVEVDIAITSTLDVVGKTLIIKGTKPDGSRAVLDGGRVGGSGGTQVLYMDTDSTVTIDGVAIKNGYTVSTHKQMKEPHQQCHSSCLHPLTHPQQSTHT